MSAEHLDLDALADLLAADALTSDDLGGDLRHLAQCPACQATLAELEAALVPVGAALAGLPVPVLPDAIAGRLEAALAAERRSTESAAASAPLAESASGRPPAPPQGTVTPLAARRDRRTRWLPAASGVAAAAVLVFGAVLMFPGGNDQSKDGSSALSQADGIASSNTGTNYRKDGAALTQALPSLLSATADSRGLAPQFGAPTRDAPTGAEITSGDPLAGLRNPTTLASCLASLSEASDPGIPLALDYASFEGQPALVVVLPAKRADKVDVFVVSASCSQADAQVLFFTRLTKPV